MIFYNAIRQLKKESARSPFAILAAGFAFISTIYASWKILNEAFSLFGIQFAAFLAWVFAFLLTLSIVKYMEHNLSKVYGLTTNSKYVLNDVEQSWHIAADGSRRVWCRRTLMFFEDPGPDDCVDVLFGSLALGEEALGYNTPDASVRLFRQVRDDTVSAYWEPMSGTLAAGDFYVHEFSYAYPQGNTALEKSITVASRVHVRRVVLQVTSDRKITGVRVKRNDDVVAFWDEAKISSPDGDVYVGFLKGVSERRADLIFEKLAPGDAYFINLTFAEV